MTSGECQKGSSGPAVVWECGAEVGDVVVEVAGSCLDSCCVGGCDGGGGIGKLSSAVTVLLPTSGPILSVEEDIPMVIFLEWT